MADEQQEKNEESLPKPSVKEAAAASNVTATKAEGAGKGNGAGDRKRITSESSLSEDTTAELQQVCSDAFNKIAEYLNGELTGSMDDYELLEKLNNLTTAKYQEMSTTAKTLISSMEELDDKYKSLQPYLEQIDKVEDSVASLEQAAYRLDAYSKKLENRFKRLEKR